MSFGRLKSPPRSPPSSLSRTPVPRQTVPQLDRLAVLERAVAKLHQQQDALAQTVVLAERIGSLQASESEIRSLQQRLSDLESRDDQQNQDLDSILLPESLPGIEPDLRALRKVLISLEALLPAAQIRNRLDLKVRDRQGCEVELKAEVLSFMKSSEAAISQVREEFAKLCAEFAEIEGLRESQKSTREFQVRMLSDQERLLDMFTAQQLLADEPLQQELLSLIDSAGDALTQHMSVILTQLDVMSKQEVLGLKALAAAVTVWSGTAPWAPQQEAARSALQLLGTETLAGLEESASAASIALQEIVSAFAAHIAARPVPDYEIKAKTVLFDQLLNSELFQLEVLSAKTHEVRRRLALDLPRFAQIAAPEDEQFKEMQTALPARLAQVKTRLKTLADELLAVWKRMNDEGELDVPLPDRRELWEDLK